MLIQSQVRKFLDEFSTGAMEQRHFTASVYEPIYRCMMTVYDTLKPDKYHGPKLTAMLHEWATAGWYVDTPSCSFRAEKVCSHMAGIQINEQGPSTTIRRATVILD